MPKKKPAKEAARKRPTQEQVAAEIAALTKLKPTVRETSAFGDNHHDAIDAQLFVLEGRVSEGEIYQRYGLDEELEEDEQDFSQNVFDSALDARRWLDGEDEEALSLGWKSLVVK